MSNDALSEPRKPVAPRMNLAFVDGVRGLCAFYVVLHHAGATIDNNTHLAPLSRPFALLGKLLIHGHDSVVVFIVISGYCLMIPVARSAQGALSGGLADYFRRRMRRILPPYYAALLLTLAVIWATPGLRQVSGRFWDAALPALTLGPIVSHLLLIHDFSFQWFTRIDPAMWSIAVEWHIYFIFPLLLILYRRWGIVASIVGAFLLWMAIHLLSHGRFDYAQPHFILAFAFGMAASVFSFRSGESWDRWRRTVPWGWIALALFIGLGISTVIKSGAADDSRVVYIDTILLAPLAAALLVFCATQVQAAADAPRRTGVLAFLEMPWLVRLGVFSYSLYLVHIPIQAWFYLWMPQSLSADKQLAILLFLVTPICVLVAYGFHLLFEKPFMSHGVKPKASDHAAP